MGFVVLALRRLFRAALSGRPKSHRSLREAAPAIRPRPGAGRGPDPQGVPTAPPPLPSTTSISGPCYVVDGDTIYIRGVSIRLAGIDAPELDHPYGRIAKNALFQLCRNQPVRAEFVGETTHERHVAICYLPDGRDLAAEMVRLGHAVDWRKYSGGRYRHLEPDGIRRRLWRCDARQKGRFPPPGR
jgi:endonuclease YncB( thermonuclease family)